MIVLQVARDGGHNIFIVHDLLVFYFFNLISEGDFTMSSHFMFY